MTFDHLNRQEEAKEAIRGLLDSAHGFGADHAEVNFRANQGFELTVRQGTVETLESYEDSQVTVTVYIQQQKGVASTTQVDEASALKDCVQAAVAIARETSSDPCHGLVEPSSMPEHVLDLDLYHPWSISVEQAIHMATRCEQAGLSYDDRVCRTEGASLSTSQSVTAYGNSHGFIGAYPSTRQGLSCVLIGQDPQSNAMQRGYDQSSARQSSGLHDPEALGRSAAKRTAERLGGKPIKTGEYPVLFSRSCAHAFWYALIQAISGSALYQKSSFLLDSLGQPLFPEWLSLKEAPFLKTALGSAPFDAEGASPKTRYLIEQGRVSGYVLSAYSARKLGLTTTGNAGGLHNLLVQAPTVPFQTLLETMGTGLWVTDYLGAGANIITGDFSQGVSGFWVEGGLVRHPVEQVTMAGHLKTMFAELIAVGDDVDKQRLIQTGSLLVKNMTVAGQG